MSKMTRLWNIVRRAVVGFYDDQGTQHAAAMTYYALMSLFPAALLALALLGLLGEYPRTYDSLLSYLDNVVPKSTLATLDASLRGALREKGTAATALILSVILALYGTTGVLESARRGLNVVFEVEAGRKIVRRKAVDVLSTFVLMFGVLATLIFTFVGGDFARELLGFAGLGETAAEIWGILRWPAAVLLAGMAFAFVYYKTPDVRHRSFTAVLPGAAVAVVLWITISLLFSTYLSEYATVTAVYGAFGSAIVLLVWLWLTNVVLLFGAQITAELERERELAEGVPLGRTLALTPKH